MIKGTRGKELILLVSVALPLFFFGCTQSPQKGGITAPPPLPPAQNKPMDAPIPAEQAPAPVGVVTGEGEAGTEAPLPAGSEAQGIESGEGVPSTPPPMPDGSDPPPPGAPIPPLPPGVPTGAPIEQPTPGGDTGGAQQPAPGAGEATGSTGESSKKEKGDTTP